MKHYIDEEINKYNWSIITTKDKLTDDVLTCDLYMNGIYICTINDKTYINARINIIANETISKIERKTEELPFN